MTRLIPHALLVLLVSGIAVSAQNAESLRLEGRAARLAGQYETAISKLQDATKAEPENADIHVEMGLALTGLEQYAEAGVAFRRALAISPDYGDAKLGLARLEYFQGRFPEARAIAAKLGGTASEGDAKALTAEIDRAVAAREEAARALAAAGRAREEEARIKEAAAREQEEAGKAVKITPPSGRKAMRPAVRINLDAYDVTPAAAVPAPTRWRLDLDGSRSTLTGDRPGWRDGTGRLGYEVSPGTVVSGGFLAANRYDQDDTYLEARVDHKPTDSISFYLQAGATPDADFLPEWSAGAGGSYRVYQGTGFAAATVLTLDGRVSDYTTGTVQTYATGFEQYFLDGRIWLTYRWIHMLDAEGDYHNGYLLRADFAFNDQLRIFAGYADAPETDQGLTFETRSVFGGAVIALDDRTDLKISFSHEERVDLFDLNSISTGLTYRF
jgi:YaiO family outer membrane protein